MTNRFAIGISLAFFAVLIVGILVALGVTSLPQPAPAQAVAAEPVQPAASVAEAPPTPVVMEQPPPATPAIAQAAAAFVPSQPTGVEVRKADLDNLAAAVKLGQPNAEGVSKDVWIRETPVAQKLLQGLCDCDQRNWLNHFVKTGNEAISGSEDYYQSIQLLAQLRRGNQDSPVNQSGH